MGNNNLKKELYELIKTDESIFDFIQECGSDGLWYWDLGNPENNWVNPRFWTVLGYNPHDIPQKLSPWKEIINPDDLKILKENLTKLYQNPENQYDQVIKYIHKNGSTVWMRCRGVLIMDKSGKPIRMLGTHHNITENKQAEEEFHRLNAELNTAKSEAGDFKEFMDSVPGFGFAKDINLTYVSANRIFCDLLKIPYDQIKGKTDYNIFPADLAEKYIADDKRVIETGQSILVEEVTFDARSNQRFVVATRKHPWFDKDGKIIGIYGIGFDITEFKKAEEELINEASRRRILMEQSRDGIVIINESGKVVESNQRFADMLGYPLEWMNQLSVLDWEYLHPPHRVIEMVKTVDEKGDHFETKHRRKDGSIYDVEISTNAAWFDGQKLIFCVCRDITERKKAEERIAKHQRDLIEINRIGTIASSSLEKEVVLNLILENVTKALNASVGMIFLKDSESDLLKWGASLGLSEEFEVEFKKNSIKIGEGLTGTIAKTREPIFIQENSTNDPRVTRSVIHKEGLNSFVGVPLLAGDELVGVMNILTRLPVALSYDDLQICSAIGSQVGLAISNANLYAQQKKVEQELIVSKEKTEKSEYQLKAMVNAVPDLLFRINTSGEFLSYKADTKDLYYRTDTIIGKNYKEIMPPHFVDILNKNIESAIKTEEIQTFEYSLEIPERGSRIYEARMSKSGEHEVTTIVRDITEQKALSLEIINAKERAEESRTKLSAALESMTDAVFISDTEGNFIDFNEAFATFHKFKNKKECAKALKEYPMFLNVYLPTGELANFEQWAVPSALRGEIKTNAEFTLIRKDTGETWIGSYSFAPIRNNESEIIGSVVVGRDITEMKQTEIKLKRAKERAEESDSLKTAFLQNMSHEIRSPLNVIIGFSERMSSPKITEEKRKFYTDIIIKSGFQLLSIVTDILTISSIDTGQEEVRNENINVNTLISENEAIFKQQADAKHIKIKAVKPLLDSDAEVLTDRTKINQILSNLLSNAIKFTSEGEIKFGYTLKNNELEFFVKDNGIGIDKSKHKAIFERFVQADDSIRTDFGGTGLGLSICKGFIELLGGRIWVESELGKGAVFFFTIPYISINHKKEAIEIRQQPLQELANVTVLVADDEVYSFLYLEEFLLDNVCSVIYAKNGQIAVNICKENKAIDLVLIDVRMPVMDGITAAKLIKEFRPNLPVIAQSAYATSQDIEKTRDIFDDYITKPITEEKLKNVLRKFIKSDK